MGGESQAPGDLGSFRAQQIRGDYRSLIRCKADSRFIDSYTGRLKNQTRWRGDGGVGGETKQGHQILISDVKTTRTQEEISNHGDVRSGQGRLDESC